MNENQLDELLDTFKEDILKESGKQVPKSKIRMKRNYSVRPWKEDGKDKPEKNLENKIGGSKIVPETFSTLSEAKETSSELFFKIVLNKPLQAILLFIGLGIAAHFGLKRVWPSSYVSSGQYYLKSDEYVDLFTRYKDALSTTRVFFPPEKNFQDLDFVFSFLNSGILKKSLLTGFYKTDPSIESQCAKKCNTDFLYVRTNFLVVINSQAASPELALKLTHFSREFLLKKFQEFQTEHFESFGSWIVKNREKYAQVIAEDQTRLQLVNQQKEVIQPREQVELLNTTKMRLERLLQSNHLEDYASSDINEVQEILKNTPDIPDSNNPEVSSFIGAKRSESLSRVQEIVKARLKFVRSEIDLQKQKVRNVDVGGPKMADDPNNEFSQNEHDWVTMNIKRNQEDLRRLSIVEATYNEGQVFSPGFIGNLIEPVADSSNVFPRRSIRVAASVVLAVIWTLVVLYLLQFFWPKVVSKYALSKNLATYARVPILSLSELRQEILGEPTSHPMIVLLKGQPNLKVIGLGLAKDLHGAEKRVLFVEFPKPGASIPPNDAIGRRVRGPSLLFHRSIEQFLKELPVNANYQHILLWLGNESLASNSSLEPYIEQSQVKCLQLVGPGDSMKEINESLLDAKTRDLPLAGVFCSAQEIKDQNHSFEQSHYSSFHQMPLESLGEV